jgi:hypothetical protein
MYTPPDTAIAAIGAEGEARKLLNRLDDFIVATNDSVPAASMAAPGPWVAKIVNTKVSPTVTPSLVPGKVTGK